MTFDLESHGRGHAPTYPPGDFSDHLPMAWLAMRGLGAPTGRRDAFAAAYLPRLLPLAADDPYRNRQDALLAEIRADGISTVLGRHLPGLISGWYRDAYHPLIRLAYGAQFEVAGEVAAGLAYLERCGADSTVARLAGAAVDVPGSGLELFRRAEGREVRWGAAASFDDRAAAVLAQPWFPALAAIVDDNLRQMSRAALGAFAATHDFFALHLVTGSHAFRLVHDHAGPHADAMMNLGLLIGYLVIGAPVFAEASHSSAPALDAERLLELCRDDEHELKVAYTAWDQSRHWQDRGYLSVVERYLQRQH